MVVGSVSLAERGSRAERKPRSVRGERSVSWLYAKVLLARKSYRQAVPG
jgi:hypothetical protein